MKRVPSTGSKNLLRRSTSGQNLLFNSVGVRCFKRMHLHLTGVDEAMKENEKTKNKIIILTIDSDRCRYRYARYT